MTTICKHCGTVQRERTLPGSGWIELVLWLCYIVPGLIYSIWRRSGRTAGACTACGSRDLVPLETPVGAALAQQYGTGSAPAAETKTPAGSQAWVVVLLAVLATAVALWRQFGR